MDLIFFFITRFYYYFNCDNDDWYHVL